MDYEKKYEVLYNGVTRVIDELKIAIYSEKLPPSALRYMSDLKYYKMRAENLERDLERMKALKERETKRRIVKPVKISRQK